MPRWFAGLDRWPMVAAANQLMTNTMTGLRSGEASAGLAGRRLPSCPYFLRLTRITGCPSEALRRYFVEGCSGETAAPPVKDPQRVADPATLRRWFPSLDSSQPPFSFLAPEDACHQCLAQQDRDPWGCCRCAGTAYPRFWPASGPCGYKKTAAAHHRCLGSPLLCSSAQPREAKTAP